MLFHFTYVPAIPPVVPVDGMSVLLVVEGWGSSEY